jgi:hypothetical protein
MIGPANNSVYKVSLVNYTGTPVGMR